MPSYSTADDVQAAAGGQREFMLLTDPQMTGMSDAAELAQVQLEADTWMDTYIQRRFATPLAAPVPTAIRIAAAAEAVYLLRVRRNRVSDTDQKRHEERIAWLDRVSKGMVSPGIDPEPPKSTAVVPQILDRALSETISRASLKGFC